MSQEMVQTGGDPAPDWLVPKLRYEGQLICTQCKEPIPFEAEDVEVAVVYRDGRTVSHCHHRPFDQNDPNIVAILGSRKCAQQWWLTDRKKEPRR